MFVVGLLIQLVVLVVAMVIAGLIIRWIVANPEKAKAAVRRIRRHLFTPLVHARAVRAYLSWKRVRMEFSYSECLSREWEKYDKKHCPDQPYYRL